MSVRIDRETKRRLLRDVLRVRRVEERIVALYPEQEMRCPTHFSIGQEAAAAGVCAHLTGDDHVISAHRSHAHYLCAGGDLKRMLAELYGKATGCAGGKGGSMHLIDHEVNFLGCVPIVGSTIPIGVGAALGARLDGKRGVIVVFFGDGAVETGVFHESINYAATYRLPVVFVCENNLYSVNTPLAERQPPGRSIIALAQGHGVRAASADGQSCEAVHDTAGPLFESARGGDGPVLVEFMTYRWLEHCGPNPDLNLGFRPDGEYEAWMARDPVELTRARFLDDDTVDEADLEAWEAEIAAEIDQAVAFAKQSPFPPREALMEGVFAGRDT